ncbi:MAG: MFS transporter [Burkholderiales bacterium]|nr:MFS transporter [Burkholderiales bacterium]
MQSATQPRAPGLPPLWLALAVWSFGAALYLIGFFQRVAPAVITQELMTEFAMGAAALGNLSAFYYYSYVAMQIPTGMLADHWGPRRLLTAGAGVAAAGGALFALSPGYMLVGAGRLLIGAAVGVAFVSMLKLASHWFHARHFAMMSGIALMCGVIGAVSAGLPLRVLVDAFGWRPVMLGVAGLTAALCAATWLAVRDDPAERGFRSHFAGGHSAARRHSMLGGLRAVVRVANVWLIFFAAGGISGPTLTFAGLWGVPFLTTHYGLTTRESALLASVVLVAWALAGPVMGAASDRVRARKPLFILGAGVAAIGWIVVLQFGGLPLPVLVGVLALTGVASGAVMVSFAFAKESVPAHLAGTVSGVINMGNMLGGLIMQPAVGWILDRHWDGALVNGARVYSFDAFRSGFSLMLVWIFLSVVAALATRETHCRQSR